ncbi:MAG: flagellar hook-length control protein FliK [Candidatus Zixiibacteriota bacterium]
MLPVTTNILDQLLGGFETNPLASAGLTGASDKAAPGGLLFGELMAQLFANAAPEATPHNNKIINSLFPSIDQPAAQDGAPAGLTVYSDTLIETNPTPLPLLPLDLHSVTSIELSSNADLPRAPILPAALRAEISPAQFELPAMPQTITGAELPAGVYNILDARVDGGQIVLIATVPDSAAEPVRISVPVQMVQQALTERTQRVDWAAGDPWSAVPVSSAEKLAVNPLDTLLRNLNLRTLEISNAADLPPAKSDPAGVGISLITENSGTRLTLFPRSAGRNTTQAIAVRSPLDSISSLEPSDITFPADHPDSQVPATQLEAEVVMPQNKVVAEQKFNLSERLMTSLKWESPSSTFQTAPSANDTGANNVHATPRQTLSPTVKLTLPEAIHRPLFSTGQTIMIKIEPEHLGPARLNLSVRDHMVTARVTVDTPLAKAAVERSLDQLTEQLSRAGFDVDRIDVMLSDHGSRDQFFDRRPLWSHGHKLQDRREADQFDASSVVSPSQSMMAVRQYVEHDGVNVLA